MYDVLGEGLAQSKHDSAAKSDVFLKEESSGRRRDASNRDWFQMAAYGKWLVLGVMVLLFVVGVALVFAGIVDESNAAPSDWIKYRQY